MKRTDAYQLADIRLNFASLRLQLALLNATREERGNPRWYLQPRAPRGVPEGGQWIDAVLPALGQLLLRAPQILRALRGLATSVRRWLDRPPRRWSGPKPEERDFDEDTGRIGKPTERRPEHPQLRFRSFREFKDFMGPAGEGYEWHHIVEQRLAENGRFPPAEIYNTDNIVRLPRDVHLCVNARMSSLRRYSDGLIVRKWLERMSFEDQFDIGLGMIEECLELLGKSR